ncbi:Centrin [Hexamita inflata]|uniref:Centrin n=1 Tax=Hexamita inflata TaxID=28002 RepID=A0AA86V0G2_9EUKA|nr:Centrin [Hexamita inflata]
MHITNEQKLQLEELFKVIDLDGNGLIDEYEIQELLEHANIKYDRKFFINLLKKGDKDNNGYIDIDEFIAIMSAAPVDLKKIFQFVDTNSDNIIQKDEMKHLFLEKSNIKLSDQELDIMMELITGTAGKDTVTWEEFNTYFTKVIMKQDNLDIE